MKKKYLLSRKAKEENNNASKKGGAKSNSVTAKNEMNAKNENDKSCKQHQMKGLDAQAKGRSRESKLDGVQKKRKLDDLGVAEKSISKTSKLDDLGVAEKSTSKTSRKKVVKNSKLDEVHTYVKQNSARTVNSRKQKNIQDDVLKKPDSSAVDNVRKRTAKDSKVLKKQMVIAQAV